MSRFTVASSAVGQSGRWLVIDQERNLAVASWETRTAADADCAWRNQRELQAAGVAVTDTTQGPCAVSTHRVPLDAASAGISRVPAANKNAGAPLRTAARTTHRGEASDEHPE